MGRVTVCKEVTFDCAHMLSGHEGLCKNLHGHTYKVQVQVYGEQIESGPSAGMVIDFKDLKGAIETCIMAQFDHAVIFSAENCRGEAESELLNWASKNGMRYYIMPYRTTAENMSQHFTELICMYFEQHDIHPANVHVRVYETPTSYAEV